MKLTDAQRELLAYLYSCEWSTPKLIKRAGHARGTINACLRRGLVEERRSPVGGERIYITGLGRGHRREMHSDV